jgi:D-alanyl-lipoteichoic acid acyltransferase DltB (MBOAT superfamily)
VAFTAFLSFFPQLVAGPIERATNLLPQFQKKRTFDYAQAVDGMRQILWGLFKKIVVADNCATYVDQVWATYDTQSGSTLLLAAILFTFQIYGDFSGYSDIAIGTAKLFGIQLMRNFNVPYFSRDIAEFWRRWHISLTSWFRDYVYIPLGGNGRKASPKSSPEGKDLHDIDKGSLPIGRAGVGLHLRNTFVIFLLSGFWHGANWTFIIWGIYHALLFVPLLLMGKNRRYVHQKLNASEWSRMLLTLVLVMMGWVLFRAPSIADAWGYICGMGTASLFTLPVITNPIVWFTLLMIVLMIAIEWRGRERDTAPLPHNRWVYYAIVLLIYWFATDKTTEFIYFQF